MPAALPTPAALFVVSPAGLAGDDADGDAAGATGRLNRLSGVNRDSRERPGAPILASVFDVGGVILLVLLLEVEACGVPAAGLFESVYKTEKGWK